ncbi:unnamed protein product [Rhizoctonia solani]|uniref:F-box domain-containing protein n=1 Tax=Rhizoctonia solani TaxID=456999 RepID=A0A8H3ATT4_9AGAM|nr:unnamed protein product [Rhizoctonia solani]
MIEGLHNVTHRRLPLMDTNTLPFGGLSPELIIQILHYCECLSILNFAATCRLFHDLVARSTSLQLHLELEANGLELLKGSFQRDATYSVILKDLRRFRDAWLDLDFSNPVERLVGESDMLLWELREGFYIRAFSQAGGRFPDSIQFIPLDSGILVHPPLIFDFTFNEFTADPEQKLLAILSRGPHRDNRVYVHLCSSITGLAHPLARHPRLVAEFDFDPPYFWPGFSIEIMEHVVLAKVSHPHTHKYELLIWDWRSGAFLNRISSRGGICDFTFLDQQHLVVSSGTRSDQIHLDTLELLVFAISNDSSACATSDGSLRIADSLVSEPILRLGFPQIKDLSKISETGFFIRSQPTPGRAMHKSSATFVCAYATTLSMTFCFREAAAGWEGPPYYRVFIDGKFIRDQIRTAPLESGTKVLPWSSWGTNATRWFIALDEPDHWICWMSGSRYIASLPNQPHYCVFDFSPRIVGRFRDRFAQTNPAAFDHLVDTSDLAMADGFHDVDHLASDLGLFSLKSPPEHRSFAITVGADNPSVIDNDEDLGFEERITSRLPYRLVFRTDHKESYEAWQINGNFLVGINTQGVSEALTAYKLNRYFSLRSSLVSLRPMKDPFPYFSSLSDELIIQILHFCTYDIILRFAATNQRHYTILSNSIALKFHIELEVNGLHVVEGSGKGSATYSRLLDELVCYRDAWLNLDLEKPIERISHREMLLWELREGNYVVAFTSKSDPMWGTDSWGPDSMQLTPIGSLETPQPITFPSVYNELTLDFEQELVALVRTNPNNKTSLEVRLCSTVTGLAHPLARNPIFFLQIDFPIPGPGHQTFTLEVIGDILVVRVADILDNKYEIMAWNWKSGALLCRIGSTSGIADFTLLDRTHLALFSVVADEQGPRLITISLYSMIPQTPDEIPMGPYFYATEYACARPVLVFEFPKLDHAYQVSSRVIMRSDPIPGRATYTKSASFAHSTALTFSIIMSLLQSSSPEMNEDSAHFRIFVSTKSLLSYLLESVGQEDTTVISWEVWGPQATRWFLCERQTTYWVYWTSGSRFVRVNDNPHAELDNLSVFDFHPPTVKRFVCTSAATEQQSLHEERMKENVLKGRGLIIPHPQILDPDTNHAALLIDTVGRDMPTVIETGFSVQVESRLPYRVVTRPASVMWREDWSIDGNHIIGMMTQVQDSFDQLTVYKLRV